jgi:hypothetical protein
MQTNEERTQSSPQRTIKRLEDRGIRFKAKGTRFDVRLPIELSREIVINRGKPTERRIPERKRFGTRQEAIDWALLRANGAQVIGERFIDMEHDDRDASLRLLDGIKERGGEAQDVVDDVLAA